MNVRERESYRNR